MIKKIKKLKKINCIAKEVIKTLLLHSVLYGIHPSLIIKHNKKKK